MPEVTIHVCHEVIYLAVPRKGTTRRKAQALLKRKATELGAVPENFFNGGLLGDPSPTLFGLRAKRNDPVEPAQLKELAA